MYTCKRLFASNSKQLNKVNSTATGVKLPCPDLIKRKTSADSKSPAWSCIAVAKGPALPLVISGTSVMAAVALKKKVNRSAECAVCGTHRFVPESNLVLKVRRVKKLSRIKANIAYTVTGNKIT